MKHTRTISWHDPKANMRDAASISGLDYLRTIRAGKREPPPVARLIGYRVAEVENGFAAFELEPAEYHYNPFATVHGGIVTTLMDTAMTACVLPTLEKGYTCSTVEIKVNFVRSVSEKTGPIRCEARPVHVGKRLATVEAQVKDTAGNILAHGISTCSIIRIGPS